MMTARKLREPNMKYLSIRAVNILHAAHHNDASRAGLNGKKRADVKYATRVMLDEADPDWRSRTPAAAQAVPEVIAELDAWLRDVRHTKPWLKSAESRTRAAVRACGAPLPDGRGNIPLPAAWFAVKSAIAEGPWEIIRPFAHDSNNHGAKPFDVTDGLFQDFAKRHIARCEQKSATQTVRAITVTWNGIAPGLGLPLLAEPLPYVDCGHYLPNESEFAPTLLDELDRCVRSWTTVPRRGRQLNTKSAAAARYCVLLTIAAGCKAKGRSVAEFKSLTESLTSDNLIPAFEFMIERAQQQNPIARRTDGAYQACRAVRDAARIILPVGHAIHGELGRMVLALTPGGRKLADDDENKSSGRGQRSRTRKIRLPSPRKQQALLPVQDDAYSAGLRSLPYRLYAEMESNEHPDNHLVTVLTHACALEIMMGTSLWPYHIARLTLSRHVVEIRDVGERSRWFIHVLAEETNHGQPREYEIVGFSRDILETYIKRIRPMRRWHESDFLFSGKRSVGYHPNALSQAVCRLVTEGTGHRVPAKDLRAAIAVMFGLSQNGSDAIVQKFLARRQTDNDPVINLIAAWRRAKRDPKR